MGAWSTDSFGNDTAGDWSGALQNTSNLSLVRETIQKAVDAGDKYIDADTASEVIAAVEVIARLKGNFGVRDSYSESTDAWVEDHPQQPPQELVALAVRALDRILVQPSELLELWEESDEFEAWKNSVLDLKNRAGALADISK
jgi:hypothetical protein